MELKTVSPDAKTNKAHDGILSPDANTNKAVWHAIRGKYMYFSKGANRDYDANLMTSILKDAMRKVQPKGAFQREIYTRGFVGKKMSPHGWASYLFTFWPES